MPTFKGFVSMLQVRDDGWGEVTLSAPHAGITSHNFFVRDLDGAPGEANRRLSQIGLLRDALARSLPVEINYRSDPEMGDLIEDVVLRPRASLAGRGNTQRVVGTVIGLATMEVGPTSAASAYLDPPDIAVVTLLLDDGGLLQASLDLQRPDPLAAQGALALLAKVHRTRRPVALTLGADAGTKTDNQRAAFNAVRGGPGWVLAVELEAVPAAELQEIYAFVERLGQRYESIDSDSATALSHVRVQYTTTPGQTPEGDVSDNGSFVPTAGVAWVHGDSPLLQRLNEALRDHLMVRLGLREDRVHEVVLIAKMGSAARPVWIEMRRQVLPASSHARRCDNVPTVQGPGGTTFQDLPLALSWVGHGYFAEGVWRFAVVASCGVTLTVDCKEPCRDEPGCPCSEPEPDDAAAGLPAWAAACRTPLTRDPTAHQFHSYLKGLHRVEIVLDGRACQDPFEMRAYRIR